MRSIDAALDWMVDQRDAGPRRGREIVQRDERQPRAAENYFLANVITYIPPEKHGTKLVSPATRRTSRWHDRRQKGDVDRVLACTRSKSV